MGGHGSSGDVYDSSGGSSSGYGLGTKRIGSSTHGYGTKYKKRGYISDKSNDYSGENPFYVNISRMSPLGSVVYVTKVLLSFHLVPSFCKLFSKLK